LEVLEAKVLEEQQHQKLKQQRRAFPQTASNKRVSTPNWGVETKQHHRAWGCEMEINGWWLSLGLVGFPVGWVWDSKKK